MKSILNSRVKFRESFRPYAPLILLDEVREWFDVPPEISESPFMLRVMHFHERRKSEVPAVVHVDGTGRVQTLVNDRNHQRLFLLLQEFRNHTGIPLLLNTSLNTAGDPIAESPEDALWYLLSTGLDGCVLEDTLVVKNSDFASVLDLNPKLHLLQMSEYQSPKPPHLPPGALQPDSFWCVSGPVETTERVRAIAGTDIENMVCAVVKGPYGDVVHTMDVKWASVLMLIDGIHNGWEIVEQLRKIDERCSKRTLYRLLGRLRLGSGVSLLA